MRNKKKNEKPRKLVCRCCDLIVHIILWVCCDTKNIQFWCPNQQHLYSNVRYRCRPGGIKKQRAVFFIHVLFRCCAGHILHRIEYLYIVMYIIFAGSKRKIRSVLLLLLLLTIIFFLFYMLVASAPALALVAIALPSPLSLFFMCWTGGRIQMYINQYECVHILSVPILQYTIFGRKYTNTLSHPQYRKLFSCVHVAIYNKYMWILFSPFLQNSYMLYVILPMQTSAHLPTEEYQFLATIFRGLSRPVQNQLKT